MKIKLIPLGLVIPAVVLAQPMPPALPEGMTQNQIRLMQRSTIGDTLFFAFFRASEAFAR
jgi:hypothetical protein